ncbi:hypothetical protein E2C01_007094 [Portunus trituberculatus]|uniref:Uncharacterized protein n=1 Tax=Portunus trituberculatus TaxID=210409 RepID=A0A5B7CY89_PORTR|nr:hypothetical protein [Portunus trituberculatus]
MPGLVSATKSGQEDQFLALFSSPRESRVTSSARGSSVGPAVQCGVAQAKHHTLIHTPFTFLPQLASGAKCLMCHHSAPQEFTATRSASVSASSRWCVVSRMVRPLRLLLITSHMMERAAGSMPEVGSSRTTSLEFPTKARAMQRRRRSPSDSWWDM